MVADMVKLQRLIGCRPGELCVMKSQDIDRSADVWLYVPESHKNEHRGKHRIILLGPKAQAILRPWLLKAGDGYCFKARGRRGQPLRVRSYRETIHRACKRAGIPKWNPNQIRHTAGTDIRSKYGLEAAQIVLGHATADVTQVYAERDLAKAVEIMREVG